MAKFLLLNREEEYVQTLKNVTSAKGNKIINGEDTLDLTIFDTEIEKNYRILLQDNYGKWHEYIVQEIEETHTDKGIRKKVYCESSIYETIGDFIEDRRFNNTSALMALTGVLQQTRWEVGRVDELGVASYSPYRVDAKTAIQTIAKTWKGELQTRIEVSGNRITGRYIDLLKKIGYETGKRFSWTKDIQQIKRTVVRDDVITALYGFGKGEEVGEGFGRRLDFSDINDGKMYVENNEAKEQFGRLDENGNKVHIFGKVEFDDETEKTTLKEKTEAELEVFSKPLLSYSADVLDLKQFGYEHEGYELGDTVLVIDKEFKPELRVLARIIEKETDYLEELNSNVTIGNFIPTSTSEDLKNEGYINNFRDKSGVWDRSNYISEDGRIFIDDLLDQLNAKANATGGYFYYTEGEGTITTDRPIDENPTMAVEIKGGSIRIADSKLPDGTWNWRTAMTGDGITLDAVNTGVLTAGRILSALSGSYWDLDNDVFHMENGDIQLLDTETGNLISLDYRGISTISGSDGSYTRLTPNGSVVSANGLDGRYATLANGRSWYYNEDGSAVLNIGAHEVNGMSGFRKGVLATARAQPLIIGRYDDYLINNPNAKVNPYISLEYEATPGDESRAFIKLWRELSMYGKGVRDIQYLSGYELSIRSTEGRLMLGVLGSDGTPYNTLQIGYANTRSYGNIEMQPGYEVTQASDRRWKNIVGETETKGLEETRKLLVVDYYWKNGDGEKQIGLIAQDSPFLSVKNEDGYYGISGNKLAMLNLLAIQELDDEHQKTKEDLRNTKQELSELKALLKEKGLI